MDVMLALTLIIIMGITFAAVISYSKRKKR